jgi:hypothetical protein
LPISPEFPDLQGSGAPRLTSEPPRRMLKAAGAAGRSDNEGCRGAGRIAGTPSPDVQKDGPVAQR